MKGFRKGDDVRIKSTGELCTLRKSIYKNSTWAYVWNWHKHIDHNVRVEDIEKDERK